MKSKRVTVSPVCCVTCGQKITEEAALKKELERQARLKRKDDHAKATEEELKKFKLALKEFNSNSRGIKISLTQWAESDLDNRDLLSNLEFDLVLDGMRMSTPELTYKEAKRMLAALEEAVLGKLDKTAAV